jgi:hypothetical protein
VAGRHPDVDHDEVGALCADGAEELVGVGNGGDDVEAAFGEQPGQAFAEQDESSAITIRTAAPR